MALNNYCQKNIHVLADKQFQVKNEMSDVVKHYNEK